MVINIIIIINMAATPEENHFSASARRPPGHAELASLDVHLAAAQDLPQPLAAGLGGQSQRRLFALGIARVYRDRALD